MQLLESTDTTRRQLIHDWMLAGAMTLFGWLQLALVHWVMEVGPTRGPGPRPIDFIPEPGLAMLADVRAPIGAAYVLVAAATLPLAWRRRYPIGVLATALIFATGYDILRQPPIVIVLAPLVALYTVATLQGRKTSVVCTIFGIAVTLAAVLPTMQPGRIITEAMRVTAMFAFAAALGDATRNRRAYVKAIEQRAVEAERTREEEALRRVEAERLRIARELHDVTAHSLSIVAVQAGAGQRVVDSDPAAARRAFEIIRTTSKASLDELRAILGVLRGAEEDAPLAPAGSIARIGELAASIEEAGVAVEVVSADLGEVPAFAEVSAYRIVQEALTNVVRHAEARRATVTLTREGDTLVIEVADDGRAAHEPGGEGHGIAGMRERVAALGGEFGAEPRAGGGFEVRATIPLAGAVQ